MAIINLQNLEKHEEKVCSQKWATSQRDFSLSTELLFQPRRRRRGGR